MVLRSAGKLSIFALLLVLAMALTYFYKEPLLEGMVDVSRWVSAQGYLAPLMYIAIYAIALPLFIPTLPLLLAAGMLFGVWPGLVYAFVGNVAGGLIAFWLGRTRLQSSVKKLIRRYEAVNALDLAIKNDGVKTAMLLRMSPLIPGPLLNYALGMTSLKTRHYLIAALGSLPVVFAFTLVGSTLGRFAQLGHSQSFADMSPTTIAALVAGVISTILACVFVTRKSRKLLEARQSSQSNASVGV